MFSKRLVGLTKYIWLRYQMGCYQVRCKDNGKIKPKGKPYPPTLKDSTLMLAQKKGGGAGGEKMASISVCKKVFIIFIII